MELDDDGLPAEMVRSATYRRGKLDLFDAIDPERTALLVVDMQNAWLLPGGPFETPAARRLAPRINRLAEALRARGGMVMWIRHTTARPGEPDYWAPYFDHFISLADRPAAVEALLAGSRMHEVFADLRVDPDDVVMPKYRFSLFARNPLDPEALLRARGIDTLIVTGVATNVCVESTVRDGMMRDFRVLMPHDAVAAPRAEAHLAGLRNVMQSFADVRSAGRLLALIEAA